MDCLEKKCIKHYFGSRHGKGLCTLDIAVLKKLTRLTVYKLYYRRKTFIVTAEHLYKYGGDNLTKPHVDFTTNAYQRRVFEIVYFETGDRNRKNIG